MSLNPRIFATLAAACVAAVAGCHTPPPPRAQAEPVQDASAQTVVAEIALQRGDCKAAANAYAQASLGNARLARRASEVAFACENIPAAWQAAERWRTSAPNDREASIMYAMVALKLYRIGDARSALTPVVKGVDAHHDQDMISLIELLAQESDANAALAALDGTVDEHAATPRVLSAFGALSLDAYDFNRAERRAHEALAHDASDVSALQLIARVRALRGDADGAIAIAHQIMRTGGAQASFALADTLTELDRPEEARQELERLRAEQAPAEEIDRRLALLAYQSGDWPEARRRFSDLIEKGEASESALFYLAEIATRTGDTDVALADYRQLSDSKALSLSARARAAGILLDRGKRAEGVELLDSYESEHPESGFELARTKAQLLADHGDPQGGVTVLSAALERFPEHPTLEYEQAMLLERAGHFSESVKSFEQLLAIRPNDPNLQNALGYTLADHSAELPRAEGLIRKALTVMPDNPAVLDSLAWVRLRRGDARDAVPTLERAYTISRDSEIAAHWGEALWMSGSQAQARQVWAAALARNPDSEPLKATLRRLLPSESH